MRAAVMSWPLADIMNARIADVTIDVNHYDPGLCRVGVRFSNGLACQMEIRNHNLRLDMREQILTGITHAAIDGLRDAAIAHIEERYSYLCRELQERLSDGDSSSQDAIDEWRDLTERKRNEIATVANVIDYNVVAGEVFARIRALAARHRITGTRPTHVIVDEVDSDASYPPPQPQTMQEVRGLALLMRHLTKEQRASYKRFGKFDVIGGTTGRKYTIRHGTHMNILPSGMQDEDGRNVHTMCFVPKGGLCAHDVMLAQTVALECMEIEALNVANKFA